MACTLRVYGPEFDVDAFLAVHLLDVVAVHRKGEPKYKHKPNGPLYEWSGFNLGVSNADFNAFAQQLDDAVAFLQDPANESLLESVQTWPGIESRTLDFGIQLKNLDEAPVQFYRFNPTLIQLMAKYNLQLEFSIYGVENNVSDLDL